ncbi:MAG TPA: CoB--CoM heterodisulfide reductase iron-sulfur subunit B family protein [Desulfomonilaceae bacterium]|nr:CoB--CoM heterodisulfide reductase iron-sulfur subunit B family protein [Desulfomonilaceae bacterium]
MEFSYYPGCTLTGSAQELDESFRSVAEKLGVTLREIPDWTCCGASSAHMVDHYLEAALPARDLMTAERLGKDVVAPCAGCHVRMKAASKRIQEEKELRDRFPFKGEIQILSGMDMFHKEQLMARLKERLTKPLTGLRVVPYYGCLAVRPVEVVEPQDPENPMQMDDVLDALGAEVLSWPYKTDCCGGSMALTRTDLVVKLSGKLLDMAMALEADAVVTLCPMCQANLDTRQADMSRATGKVYQVPILYLTECMGIAFQNPRAKTWFNRHIVSPETMLAGKGLI